MADDLLTEAAFAVWKAEARHTPLRWSEEAGRPETWEEAQRRRFDGLHPYRREQCEAMAKPC